MPVAPRRIEGQWGFSAFTAEAPAGTDGALLFRQNGELIGVFPIGEYNSESFIQVPQADQLAPITVEAVDCPTGQVKVTIQLERRH